MTKPCYLDDPNLGELEKSCLNRCIDSTFVSTFGPFVPEFEAAFARFLGAPGAVSVQSGTAGLHLALHEMGLGPGDEVLVPALTFVASANPVSYTGARPVFVDVDAATWNMDPDAAELRITERTRAMVIVHLYGRVCEMERLEEIARRHNLCIIEDATEALGSRYKGRPAGTLGDLGVFSFNGNKLITTGGGGMVVGPDPQRLSHIRFLANQARREEAGYFHPEIGFNYRMTNLEASLGLAQMQRLHEFIETKRRIHGIYAEAFRDVGELQLQAPCEGADDVVWLNAVTIDAAHTGTGIPEIMETLKQRGIPTRRLFMPLVCFPPYFEGHREEAYPRAVRLYSKGLCLPSSTINTAGGIRRAAEGLKSLLVKRRPRPALVSARTAGAASAMTGGSR